MASRPPSCPASKALPQGHFRNPFTLHTKPETRDPNLETRNPKPETKKEKPETSNLHPKLYTLNPTPYTLHPGPYTPNPGPNRGVSPIRKCPPPHDPPMTLGISLRKGPRGMRFIISEVTLYGLKQVRSRDRGVDCDHLLGGECQNHGHRRRGSGRDSGGRGYTLNPQPPTLNPQPSTFNPQPSTLNPQF